MKRNGKDKRGEQKDFKEPNHEGRIEESKEPAGPTEEVQRDTSGEEGRKYLSVTPHFLCRSGYRAANGLSCDKLSAFTATLLDPSPTEHFFFLVMKHSRYPHSMMKHSFSTSLSLT